MTQKNHVQISFNTARVARVARSLIAVAGTSMALKVCRATSHDLPISFRDFPATFEDTHISKQKTWFFEAGSDVQWIRCKDISVRCPRMFESWGFRICPLRYRTHQSKRSQSREENVRKLQNLLNAQPHGHWPAVSWVITCHNHFAFYPERGRTQFDWKLDQLELLLDTEIDCRAKQNTCRGTVHKILKQVYVYVIFFVCFQNQPWVFLPSWILGAADMSPTLKKTIRWQVAAKILANLDGWIVASVWQLGLRPLILFIKE